MTQQNAACVAGARVARSMARDPSHQGFGLLNGFVIDANVDIPPIALQENETR